MKQKNRIRISFSAMILVFLVVFIGQYLFLNQLALELRNLSQNKFQLQASVQEARETVLSIKADIWDILLYRFSDRQQPLSRLDTQAADFYRSYRALDGALPGERRRLDALLFAFRAYYLFGTEILSTKDNATLLGSLEYLQKFKENQIELIRQLDGIGQLTKQDFDLALATMQANLSTVSLVSALWPALVIIAALILTFILTLNLTRPLEGLTVLARQAVSGDYTVRADFHSGDEVEILGTTFNRLLETIEAYSNHMETQVTLRTQDLQAKNDELELVLARLKQTQDHLIQSEKMAALGTLVAGVAHEINTPLGNSLTASSFLEHQVQLLQIEFNKNELRRSTLDEFLISLDQVSQLISSNLQRAAELIASFKRVAVDQQTNEQRRFDLREYVAEIILNHQALFHGTGHRISSEIAPGIEIDSRPGALYQIVANLIINSLRHGFSNLEHGDIAIAAHCEESILVLDYRDNGCGIDRSIAKRVFDPFFTTHRTQGGPGLGLYIAATLATGGLGGHLELVPDVEAGVHFLLRIPCKLARPIEV